MIKLFIYGLFGNPEILKFQWWKIKACLKHYTEKRNYTEKEKIQNEEDKKFIE